nr:hypothetical protein [Tanacetum cinerariifolium]
MHKAFPLPVIEFPLAEELHTASEESCHCQKKSEATAVKIALLSKTSVDESDAKTSEYTSYESDSSVEPYTSVPEPVVNESKVVSEPKAVFKPKMWIDARIIEEYESDSDDDSVSNIQENIFKT